MSNWTTNNIPSQEGKIILIIGANSGTGFGVSKALANKGAKVFMVVRNLEKGKVAAGKIKNEIFNAEIKLVELDLADLNSVDQFSKEITSKYSQLDVLINNSFLFC
jgi:NAD(P)-dependent dehydrogenase (short-subunit alcohol dehydrogenase family)